jgi:cytochrome b subunit of formate dehydrogenase
MTENIQQNVPTGLSAVQASYRRFSAEQRFEHIVLLVTFSGLALTGIPQRYAGEAWAQTMINLMGGIESIRIVHRILATILMAESIFHGGMLTYKLFVLGRKATMIPQLQDMRDVVQWIAFNLGLRREHPHLPKYNFGEKAEYLAVVWGTIVMVITGFMLWNPIATTSLLPGEVVPAAKAAHSGEAMLAVLSILTWHMYNVHVKRFNRSMFTGRLSHEEMEEEHGEELDNILQGIVEEDPPREVLDSRNRIFIPYAFGASSLLIIGLMWFITFEKSAITTINPIAVNDTVNALSVTADIGDAESGLTVWETLDCSSCHGDNALGTPGMLNIGIANTPLTFDTFVSKVRSGPADMVAYSIRDISNEDLAHLYQWLKSIED